MLVLELMVVLLMVVVVVVVDSVEPLSTAERDVHVRILMLN